MMLVRDLLKSKPSGLWSVGPDDSVYDALQLMADKNIGALLVLEGERLVGILSERDYARKVELQGRTARETPVREIMTPRVLYVRPDQNLETCMALMSEKHIRHLPVIEGERLIGMISIRDVVKALIADQQILIEQLETYITGTR